MPSGPSHDEGRQHRFIICNRPCEDGFVLVLSITGWAHDKCDPSCKIFEWEHPPLRKDSYVSYMHSKIEMATKIRKGIKDGIFRPCADLNTNIFLRATNGILKSEQSPRKIKAYWKKISR